MKKINKFFNDININFKAAFKSLAVIVGFITIIGIIVGIIIRWPLIFAFGCFVVAIIILFVLLYDMFAEKD